MLGFFVFVSALFGAVFGSFSNAVAYRLPRNETLMTRSHCTTCFHEIAWYENIPVLSWLLLRGKCRHCSQSISARYILVELGSALVFGLLTIRASVMGEGFLFNVGILLVFAFVGIVVSLVDLDVRKIPSEWVYGGFAAVLLIAMGHHILFPDSSRALTGLVWMAIFAVIHFVLWFIKPGAMGFGDVRLSLLTGFVAGWVSSETAIMAFFFPSILALAFMIPALTKKKASGKTAIPFGPWMVLGAIVSILVTDIVFGNFLMMGSVA